MRNTNLLVGAALGAGAIYMMDPQNGRRRRALVRDKLVRASHVTRNAVDTAVRDAVNRSRGMVAASQSRFRSEDVSDEVLVERVRAKLGRVCSHPHALDVLASDGTVTLRGPILEHDAPAVLRTTGRVRGVTAVMNELELHQTAEDVPALQGRGRAAARSLDILQPNWAPATRAVVAAAGLAATGLALAAYRRRPETADEVWMVGCSDIVAREPLGL